ncbi:hypothetical protein COCOBI_13-0260 [Coccomyxa sp. Obi]|nr:hypothetical protein COCOBI_13-0260 [Coccomyxa sp. Obi]
MQGASGNPSPHHHNSYGRTGKGGWRWEQAGRNAEGGAASGRSDGRGERCTGEESDGRWAGAEKGGSGLVPGGERE